MKKLSFFIIAIIILFTNHSIAEFGNIRGQSSWEKVYNSGSAISVQQTKDKGYIVAGYKYPEKDYIANPLATDAWLIKLDSNGNKLWDYTYDGKRFESIQQTKDGGYIAAGLHSSKAWVIKLYSSGRKQWDKIFGGKRIDIANSVQQTKDGGYIVAGETASKGAGGIDAWIIKLNEEGSIVGESIFGGIDDDYFTCIQQTKDGGYIAAGRNCSKGDRSCDTWVVKLNSNGIRQWDYSFGGYESDAAQYVQQTNDEGYVIAGLTYSKGVGKSDGWVFKIDRNGHMQWDETFGGKGSDSFYSIQITKDGGYIVAGRTYSKVTNDYGAWIIKLNK